MLGAANGEVIKAVIARAETEADKSDGLDLAIGRVHSGVLVVVVVVVVGIFVDPLSYSIAAKELDGETSNPGHIIVVVVVGVSVFELTSVGEDVTAHSGV